MSRVARLSADRTNQKLYFVRLACQQSEQATNVQYAQSCRESAVFHLHGAVLAYYQELSNYYSLKQINPTFDSIEHALKQLDGRISPELQLLKPALQTGFLKDLTTAYQSCQYAPANEAPKQPVDENSNSLGIAIQQDPLFWLPETSQIRDWLKQLTTMIERFRDEQQEF